MMRLGHAKLTVPLPHADNWVWWVDHSVQIGQEKCLVILGIRLADLPPRGTCLKHEDMELIALIPRISWTRKDVADALEAATARTGVPRAIIDDHGVDIAGGVSLFQTRHAQAVEIYDIKHKAACLLKRRLEKDPRWQAFHTEVSRTRCAVQQTEMAFLVPPGPKPKARFMNLKKLLRWAERILAILAAPKENVLRYVTAERLRDKFGWLEGYRDEVQQWAAWQRVVDVSVTFVNREGIYRKAADDLRRELPAQYGHETTRRLADELVAFVAAESAKARPDERLPGSTEVLESSFGRFKALEKNQAKGGFTSLVLAFGALLAKTTTAAIRAALEASRTRDVIQWCRDHLGPTLFSKRKLAFFGATKPE